MFIKGNHWSLFRRNDDSSFKKLSNFDLSKNVQETELTLEKPKPTTKLYFDVFWANKSLSRDVCFSHFRRESRKRRQRHEATDDCDLQSVN